VTNQPILVIFGIQHPEETWHWKVTKLAIANLTYKLLPHYLGKRKMGLFNKLQK